MGGSFVKHALTLTPIVTWVVTLTGGPVRAAASLPDGPAKPLVERACSSCHSIDEAVAKKRSRGQWQASVDSMIQRGAKLTDEEASRIVAYLSANFGERDRARDLFEDSCSHCHSLERINDYAMTKEEWREETKGMISEGTVLTDEELDILLDYLAKNFGPTERTAGSSVVRGSTKEIKE